MKNRTFKDAGKVQEPTSERHLENTLDSLLREVSPDGFTPEELWFLVRKFWPDVTMRAMTDVLLAMRDVGWTVCGENWYLSAAAHEAGHSGKYRRALRETEAWRELPVVLVSRAALN